MNSPETVNTLAPQLHPSPIGARELHLLTPSTPPQKNPPRKPRIAWKQQLVLAASDVTKVAKLSSNWQRREFRHVGLRFLQSLVELCKLVLKRLLEHR